MKKECKNCVFGPEPSQGCPECIACDSKHNRFVDKNSSKGKKISKETKQWQKALKEFQEEQSYGTLDKLGNFITVQPEKQIIEDIHNAFTAKNERIEYLRQENERLKKTDDSYAKMNTMDKIELLSKLNEDLNNYPLVNLTKKEDEKLKAFQHKHYNSCKKGHNHGAIGYDEYIFSIAGTGLGSIIKVKCPVCGEEIDITDNDKF